MTRKRLCSANSRDRSWTSFGRRKRCTSSLLRVLTPRARAWETTETLMRTKYKFSKSKSTPLRWLCRGPRRNRLRWVKSWRRPSSSTKPRKKRPLKWTLSSFNLRKDCSKAEKKTKASTTGSTFLKKKPKVPRKSWRTEMRSLKTPRNKRTSTSKFLRKSMSTSVSSKKAWKSKWPMPIVWRLSSNSRRKPLNKKKDRSKAWGRTKKVSKKSWLSRSKQIKLKFRSFRRKRRSLQMS